MLKAVDKMEINFIIAGIILVGTFISFGIYYSKVPMYVKLLALPFNIIFFLYTIHYVNEKLGAPIEGVPNGEFGYIYHVTTNGGKDIILWALQEDVDRLYIFEYNRENMKRLEDAKNANQSRQGSPVTLEVKNGSFVRVEDDEIITDEIGSDEKIKNETRELGQISRL